MFIFNYIGIIKLLLTTSMSRRLKQNIHKSKLYDPNSLSLTQDTDMSHQKMWNQKVEQAKHIQQQKQIDRILFGIVKQRLFGQLLSQQTRISNEGYYTLDKMSKELVNPIQIKNRRKIQPIKNQPTYDVGVSSRLKYRTIDTPRGLSSKPLSRGQNEEQAQTRKRKNTIDLQPLSKTKRSFNTPKPFQIAKVTNLNNYFRQLTNNPTSMIYDIKLTRQMLFKYNKQKQIVSPNGLQRFLHFFNFPGTANIKQYSNWIEYVANCSMRQSCFIVFQIIDESMNGCITISDLFRVLQDFPLTNNSDLQKQIYELTETIKKEIEESKLSQKYKQIKPTVEEIIVRNHSIKLEDMRDLLKQASKQLIKTDIFKSTTYHKSLYALQHNASVRQKNYQLEQTNQNQSEVNSKKNNTSRQDGIRFNEYCDIFQSRRSKIFVIMLRLLIGEEGAALIE